MTVAEVESLNVGDKLINDTFGHIWVVERMGYMGWPEIRSTFTQTAFRLLPGPNSEHFKKISPE